MNYIVFDINIGIDMLLSSLKITLFLTMYRYLHCPCNRSRAFVLILPLACSVLFPEAFVVAACKAVLQIYCVLV